MFSSPHVKPDGTCPTKKKKKGGCSFVLQEKNTDFVVKKQISSGQIRARTVHPKLFQYDDIN